jgi:hypothetical protein
MIMLYGFVLCEFARDMPDGQNQAAKHNISLYYGPVSCNHFLSLECQTRHRFYFKPANPA